MADDNLLAGVSGGLSNVRDILGQYIGLKMKSNIDSQEKERDFDLYQRKLPLDEASQIRINNAKPILPTYIIDSSGNVVNSVGGRVSREQRPFVSEEDKVLQKERAKQKIQQPQAQARLSDAEANLDALASEVDQILSSKGLGLATGITSSLGKIPGTSAKDVAARIQTLKAKTAFNTLQAMREASKTGGALGQVSDRENIMLENAVSALDTGQSTEAFKNSLLRLKNNALQTKQRLRQAYGQTYGEDTPPPVLPKTERSSDIAESGSADSILKKYGVQ